LVKVYKGMYRLVEIIENEIGCVGGGKSLKRAWSAEEIEKALKKGNKTKKKLRRLTDVAKSK